MELAMDSLKEKFDFKVRWEPFLLRPQTPPEGLPKPPAYSDPNSPGVRRLKEAGSSIGLDFTYKCPVFPNTIKPHALLEYAKEKENGQKQNEVSEKLFKKYFTDGDLLSDDTLLSVANDVGFNSEEVKQYISTQENLVKVVEKAERWSMKGISGVPTFYFNGQKMFSGAQEPETFKKMFEVVSERFPIDADSKQ